MIDIYKEPIPVSVRTKLVNSSHNIIHLSTIKDLLYYILFSFGVRVYMKEIIDDGSLLNYNIVLASLDPAEGMMRGEQYHKILNTSAHGSLNESICWEAGLRAALDWIAYNRPSDYRYLSDNVLVYFFGKFDRQRLEFFKTVLSLHTSQPKNRNKTFKFDRMEAVNPIMAQHVIDYCEFMLGPSVALSPVTVLVTSDTLSEPISNPPTTINVIDDTESSLIQQARENLESIIASSPGGRAAFDEALRADFQHYIDTNSPGTLAAEIITEMAERYPAAEHSSVIEPS